MHKLEVGQLYNPSRTSWPETVQYNFYANGHDLQLFFAGLTEMEIEEVQTGECEFALDVESGIIFFLCRFGSQPWSDAPYTWHRVPEEQRVLPEPEATSDSRALLQVLLIDASTGILKAIRAVSLSPQFTRALHRAIREQSMAVFNQEKYDADLAILYGRLSTKELLKRAILRTKGGA